MRYLKFLSAVTLSGLLLAGCASVAHVEKDDSVNFSNYHSYRVSRCKCVWAK